ncbi:MAG: VanZ family protein [Gammaproteobacteria bacterium]|nr:VanZ family protein [Gammaproteobacteria bacterium]
MIRPELRHPLLWHVIGLTYLALIVWLSLTPSPPSGVHIWDKASHFIAYTGLAGWFGAVYRPARHVAVIAAAILAGVGLEVLQGWSGLRQFEYADMLANALGASAGVLLARSPLGEALIACERLVHG